jgi:hypothetical protein
MVEGIVAEAVDAKDCCDEKNRWVSIYAKS